MDGPSRRHPDKALALLLHAVAATRPVTVEATVACNVRLTRARDFVIHRPAQNVAAGGLSISEAEFEENRSPAMRALRAHCAACGLCGVFGLTPP